MKTVNFGRLLFIAVLISSDLVVAQEKELFDDFQKILPRGGIPAIINPIYVTAQEASINDDTWVMGVLIDDQARAYSLNLLNHHEIVNDVIDTTVFAAVW
jgi:hypothetical protein